MQKTIRKTTEIYLCEDVLYSILSFVFPSQMWLNIALVNKEWRKVFTRLCKEEHESIESVIGKMKSINRLTYMYYSNWNVCFRDKYENLSSSRVFFAQHNVKLVVEFCDRILENGCAYRMERLNVKSIEYAYCWFPHAYLLSFGQRMKDKEFIKRYYGIWCLRLSLSLSPLLGDNIPTAFKKTDPIYIKYRNIEDKCTT